jgi:flagellar motor component MotA
MILATVTAVVCFCAALERPDRQTSWLACAYVATFSCTFFAVVGVSL